MASVFHDSYKSMLLGVEITLVAVFGAVSYGSALTGAWSFVLMVGLLVTLVGVIQPASSTE